VTTIAPVVTPTAALDAGPTTTATATATLPADGSAVFAWAPAEPKVKKKHTAIWISAAAGVAVVGIVVSSLVLIAPGTAVAGVPVGWLTPGAAAEAIEQRLAETTVVLTGAGEDAEITGAELGAAVDAEALADAAFAEHPMWNPTQWFAATGAEVELDAVAATAALRDAAPQLYTDPVDATLAFDPATASYVATPAVPGAGVDLATVQDAIQAAFEAGEPRVELDPLEAAVAAGISTETADATVAQLNGMLDTAGFYVGDERTVPVDRAVAASWLTVTPTADAFAITADAAAIQPLVDTLAPAVDRAPENAVVITDTAGKVLQTMAAGQSGRQLDDTAGVAAAFASQLATGNAVYELPVAEVPVSTTTLARNIVVDLSEQRTYLYENGQQIDSFLMSSGTAATPTHTGSFRINSHIRTQDMGALCYNPNAVNSYCTKNVPWVMYFNGDQGFHGTYWHHNFGNRMSHGCVNLPLGTAEFLYSWAPNGTEVRVQA
jgi:lipoprotein-anchoring transpeptidase ErfK/SrfK